MPWLLLVAMPICLAVLFGLAAFRNEAPLLFHCLRCDHYFPRKAHVAFPTACPRCRARDWNCQI